MLLSLFFLFEIALSATTTMERKALPLSPPCPKLDLHAAVKSRQAKCIAPALKHMDVNDRDVDGNAPLHNAIRLQNFAAIKMLVKHGADIRFRDFGGHNAKELAAELGLRRLEDYFAALERETERLQAAVESNDLVAASSSLMRGASLGMRDTRADTILHRAAQSNFPEMGRLLIHHGARLEARNYLGETPLHCAALREHFEFMKMLIAAGANVNAIDERRRTPLDLAGAREDPKILELWKQSRARSGSPAAVEFDWTESGPPVYLNSN